MMDTGLTAWAVDAARVESELQRFLEAASARESAGSWPPSVRRAREASLVALVRRLALTKGKRVRPLLAFWMARAFGRTVEPPEAIVRVAVCVELLHAASLVIDDVEDGSLERRGEPALHVTVGVPLALNAAGWCYFAAIEWLRSPELQALATEVLRACHEGQALDLGHASPSCAADLFAATHEERLLFYDATADFKTGALMGFVARACGAVLDLRTPVVTDVARGLADYGRAFQILDDVKNLVPALSGSKTYEDLTLGLRNRVCLHLLGGLTDLQAEEARQAYQRGAFRAFVLRQRGLKDALMRTLDEGEALRAHAAARLSTLSGERLEAFHYLSQVLDKPLVELKEALEAHAPSSVPLTIAVPTAVGATFQSRTDRVVERTTAAQADMWRSPLVGGRKA